MDRCHELINFINKIPLYNISYETLPLTSSILNIKVEIKLDFKWDKHFHGESQSYLIIVNKFHKIECFEIVNFQQINKKEPITCNFMVAIKPDEINKFSLPEFINITIWNMNYYGTLYSEMIPMSQLEMPSEDSPNTKLLDLELVPISSLQNEKYIELYKHEFLNPVQSQVFYVS